MASYVQHRPTYWLNKNYYMVYKGLLKDLPKGHNYVQHRPTYLKVHVAYLKAMLFSNYVGCDGLCSLPKVYHMMPYKLCSLPRGYVHYLRATHLLTYNIIIYRSMYILIYLPTYLPFLSYL